MIAVDGIPRSMYGDAKVAFAGVPPSLGGGAGVGDSSAGASSSMAAGPSSSSGQGVTGVWSQMFKNSREYTVLKKVVRLLQDNRLNSGDEETAQRLQDLNRSQSESYPILKTILNVIFITTGVVLLIAVVIVIIYTSIGKKLLCLPSVFTLMYMYMSIQHLVKPCLESSDYTLSFSDPPEFKF